MIKKLLWLCFLLPTMSLAAEFIEGKDYQVLTSSQITGQQSKTPEVTEFFSYGCPWCYRTESALNQWAKTAGNKVQVEKVPVVFKPEWEIYAKAYYAAKALALNAKLTPILFKSIQEDKKSLGTNDAMVKLFVAQGVNKEIAQSAFEYSPTIDMRVKNGMNLMAQYQISAVPAFVINHKYKTDLQMAGSPERLFELFDYLLKK